MTAEITQLLVRARNGEPERMADVFQALYPELMRMARSRLRGCQDTLTPTVLVHELFLRVTASEQLDLVDRRHFFAASAQALRWIMVEDARRALSQKRGGGAIHVLQHPEGDLRRRTDGADDRLRRHPHDRG